ncbi:unnamed protein product [Merluccius merluccius]
MSQSCHFCTEELEIKREEGSLRSYEGCYQQLAAHGSCCATSPVFHWAPPATVAAFGNGWCWEMAVCRHSWCPFPVGVKTFSYTTTVATMFMMPYVLFESQLATRSLAVQAIIIAIASLFTFVSPVLLHLLTKRYVIRLYHDAEEDTYTAVTYNVFMMEKKTVFKQGEVRIPAGPKMFTTFYAGPLGMMVDPDFFQLPSDYNHLMGYDQPFIFDENDLERPDKG